MFTRLTSKRKPRLKKKIKKIHKRSYLISPQTQHILGGSLFSSRVGELLLGEHFGGGEMGSVIQPVSISEMMWGFFSPPLSVGKVSLLSDSPLSDK